MQMYYGSHLKEDLIATGITIYLKTQVLLMETERSSTQKHKLALQTSSLSLHAYFHSKIVLNYVVGVVIILKVTRHSELDGL